MERSETVDVVLPPTYKKLAMGPHILMRGLPTSPNEPSRICSHLRGRGLRSPVLRERPSGYLSTLILLHEPGESNLNTHLQVGRKPKKKEPSSVCLRGGGNGNLASLPGDAEWIADLLQHGLLRASFVPARPQRELRDLTRYRSSLAADRARLESSIQKTLEDTNIKLASVATDITVGFDGLSWRM